MIISVLKTFFTTFVVLLIGVSGSAQEKEVSYNQKRNDSILYLSEKKAVEDIYEVFNDANEEKKAYKMALKLSETLKSQWGLAKNYDLLAHYFRNRALTDSSTYYAKKSLKFHKFRNDSISNRLRLNTFHTLVTNHRIKGLYEESKKWALKGIEASEKYDERYFYYKFTNGLALAYSELKNYKEAIKLFERCLDYKGKGESEIKYGSYINIANIYAYFKDFETSNNYLEKARILSKNDENYRATAIIAINLGANYHEQNNIEKALEFYKECKTIAEEKDIQNLKVLSNINIADLYALQKNYTAAKFGFRIALESAVEYNLFREQLKIYKELIDIAIQENDYKDAFILANQRHQLKDSINTLQKNAEIQELEVKFKTLQKEKEIKLLQTENANRKLDLKNQQEEIKNLVLQQQILQKENENKILNYQNASQKRVSEIELLKKDQQIQQERLKNQVTQNTRQKSINLIILYLFLILLIPIIALLVTYYQKVRTQKALNNKQEEINKQKIETLLKDKELEIVKTSIHTQDKERKRIAQELHDSIGGNLAAIKLQLNNSKEFGATDHLKIINTQIDDTYEQVRNLSHNLMPKKFSYNQFCDVVQEYLAKMGEASNINTNFSAYPRNEIDTLNNDLQEEIFKIIQELITNTIKHARATTIELQINLIGDVFNILYEDDGIGFKTDRLQEGIGLRNIKSRLHKIEGNLDIDSRIDRGSIFNIEIVNTKNVIHEISHKN